MPEKNITKTTDREESVPQTPQQCREGWIECNEGSPCGRHQKYWHDYLTRKPQPPEPAPAPAPHGWDQYMREHGQEEYQLAALAPSREEFERQKAYVQSDAIDEKDFALGWQAGRAPLLRELQEAENLLKRAQDAILTPGRIVSPKVPIRVNDVDWRQWLGGAKELLERLSKLEKESKP